MSLVAQCLRGSDPVARIKSRILLKARENKSGELRAAHIATVHASAGPSNPPGKQREERRLEWKTQRRQSYLSKCGMCLAAGHQGPGWRCAAQVQENPSQADGTLPAEGWGAQPASSDRLLVCAQTLTPLPLRVPAQPASMAMDWEPEPEPDPDPDPDPEPEPEPAPVPPTLRPPSARLAARHPPPAAPTGPPMPLDSEDPVMLQQLQVFCEYLANSNKLTPYNQLQRRLGRPRQILQLALAPGEALAQDRSS
ncbi:hypothetical protein QJQ45_019594 [Haematococcus lacustris]|nr:hypothetical protein QJQ45_019594 [Haematococcus lacustris]